MNWTIPKMNILEYFTYGFKLKNTTSLRKSWQQFELAEELVMACLHFNFCEPNAFFDNYTYSGELF